jgi:hypothetical protein
MMTGTPLASAQSHMRTTVLGFGICSPKLAGRRTVLGGERAQRGRVRMDRSGRPAQACPWR